MRDIIEFLEARISEDEAVARAAAPGPWQWFGDQARDRTMLYASDEKKVLEVYGAQSSGHLAVSGADLAHIAINSPDRILAECAAKRKILENIPLVADADDELGEVSPYVLMCLASVYRRHPEYQEGWIVDGLV